jgi:YD repeat-containing protein
MITAMMKTVLLPAILIFSILVFTSCQKEIDPKILNEKISGNPCESGFLIKVVSCTGNDSFVTTFEYDAANRLTRQVITSYDHLSPVSSDRKIIRDPQGIITQLVTKYDNTSDSDVVNVFHNPISHRYTYTNQKFYPYGLLTQDSIVFIYDASGKIIEEDLYGDHFTNGNYILDDRFVYSYDAEGNIIKLTVYDRDQSTNVIRLESTYEFTYDNKIRAQRLDMGDAFILFDPASLSAHNRTSTNITNFIFPIYNETYTHQYKYNSCDKPATDIQTRNPGNIISNVSFYYR